NAADAAEVAERADDHPRKRDEHADVPVDHERIASAAGPRDAKLDVDAGDTRNLQRSVHARESPRGGVMWASAEYSRRAEPTNSDGSAASLPRHREGYGPFKGGHAR